MIIKTREIASIYYDIEYTLDEKRITKEERIILEESKDIEAIQKIINKYNPDVISSEQDPDAFDFKIEEVKDIDFEEEN